MQWSCEISGICSCLVTAGQESESPLAWDRPLSTQYSQVIGLELAFFSHRSMDVVQFKFTKKDRYSWGPPVSELIFLITILDTLVFP